MLVRSRRNSCVILPLISKAGSSPGRESADFLALPWSLSEAHLRRHWTCLLFWKPSWDSMLSSKVHAMPVARLTGLRGQQTVRIAGCSLCWAWARNQGRDPACSLHAAHFHLIWLPKVWKVSCLQTFPCYNDLPSSAFPRLAGLELASILSFSFLSFWAFKIASVKWREVFLSQRNNNTYHV